MQRFQRAFAVLGLLGIVLALSSCENLFEQKKSDPVKTSTIGLTVGASTQTDVAAGASVDINNAVVGTPSTTTFTIKNSGNGALTLSAPTLSGTDAGLFSISTAPATTVAAGASTTFVVTFTPTAAGTGKTATITIANNSTNVASFVFTVKADATAAPVSAITVSESGTTVANAATVDFGNMASTATSSKTFTITNTGTATLTLAQAPVVSSGIFSLTGTEPSLSVIGGGSTTFTITAKPTAGGVFTGTVTLNNNSADTPFVINVKATVTSPSSGGSFTAPTISGNYYPANGSTSAYVDGNLILKFDSTPTIGTGSVKIYTSGGTLVDTINPTDETFVSGNNSGGVVGALNVKGQLIQVSGSTVVIKPHTNSTGYSILSHGTAYYVTIDSGLFTGKIGGADFGGITGSSGWTFTTAAAPTISGNTITVSPTDSSANFSTIQGALNYLRSNSSTGSWTINVGAGSYLERLFYSGTANVTLKGPAGNSYGDTAKVYWANLDLWNPGTRARPMFLWQGGDLTIQNLTLINTTDRSVVGTSSTQAETLFFDCTSNLVANNSSFVSHQDTLNLGNNGGRAWFYDCYIEGDTDYIWGTAAVALFEKCKLRSVRDYAIASQVSYIFAPRTLTTGSINKGFVLMDSTVSIDAGVTAYYGRNSGADTTAAVFNNAFTGAGTLSSALWGGTGVTYTDVAGDAALGFKDYNNTMNGSVVSTTSRLSGTYALTPNVFNREYTGRSVILNRGFNTSTSKYAAGSTWDISSYVTSFSAQTDNSTKNVFVEPVYVANLVGGTTSTLTASAYDSNTSFTWSSSDTSIATVNSSGVVTAATGVTGTAKITATSGTGGTGIATIGVIPTDIVATALSLSSFATTTMEQDDIAYITAEFTPSNTTDKTALTWTSSNTSVLTVTAVANSSKAVIYAVGPGTATISVTSSKYTSATGGTTGTITVLNDGKSIGVVPASPGYSFSFLTPDSTSSDVLLNGGTSASTSQTHAYNVGFTNTTTPTSGKYLTLMSTTKQTVVKSNYFQMKNNGFAVNVTGANIGLASSYTGNSTTSPAKWTYTVGKDGLLLHNVTGPFTLSINQNTKVGSARVIGVMVVDPTATGTVLHWAAKGFAMFDADFSTTTTFPKTYTYTYSGTDIVDVVIASSNDVYFGTITLTK